MIRNIAGKVMIGAGVALMSITVGLSAASNGTGANHAHPRPAQTPVIKPEFHFHSKAPLPPPRPDRAQLTARHRLTVHGLKPEPPGPVSVYDSAQANEIPASKDAALYADGSWTGTQQQFASHPRALWLTTDGGDLKADAVDVEAGDASPDAAAHWAWEKLHADPTSYARIYSDLAEWGACKTAVAGFSAAMRSHILWWVANPTGHPHMVPGASATQWYWGKNYDISTATPGFFNRVGK